jgi:hypothetical protein
MFNVKPGIMEYYDIHQLVYTKLNPEDSPFDKKDFHTAFYPRDFLNGTDVMVIENHIYIPVTNYFSSKQVVYFQTIKQETYLFVFDINVLANEVDSMGRGGIFICHVFMFPQLLWQKLPSPNQLMALVNEYKYKSRSELLNSQYIEKKTGNMMPIRLDSEKVESADKRIPAIDGTFEIQLLVNLSDSLNKENKEQKFIVSAPEIKARELFNKLICYLPNALKVNIGWDTMYDAGRMMDYNKTFAAYQEKAPRGGGGSSIVQVSNSKIELAKDFKIFESQTPFVKWLAGCSASIRYHFFIEEAYKLSEALLAKEIYDLPDNWNTDCFAKVNNELIDKLFLEKCKNGFKRKISKELNKIIPVKEKLFFYYDKLDLSKFADYLLTIIENSKISAGQFENGIPPDYIKYNSILILIEQLWKNKKFDIQDFNRLSDNEKLQLNKYVLKSSFFKKKWYLELTKSDETLLNYYLRQYPKPKRIIKLFHSVLKMSESEINLAGFNLMIIRKVLYFKIGHFFKRFFNIFKRKKKEKKTNFS